MKMTNKEQKQEVCEVKRIKDFVKSIDPKIVELAKKYVGEYKETNDSTTELDYLYNLESEIHGVLNMNGGLLKLSKMFLDDFKTVENMPVKIGDSVWEWKMFRSLDGDVIARLYIDGCDGDLDAFVGNNYHKKYLVHYMASLEENEFKLGVRKESDSIKMGDKFHPFIVDLFNNKKVIELPNVPEDYSDKDITIARDCIDSGIYFGYLLYDNKNLGEQEIINSYIELVNEQLVINSALKPEIVELIDMVYYDFDPSKIKPVYILGVKCEWKLFNSLNGTICTLYIDDKLTSYTITANDTTRIKHVYADLNKMELTVREYKKGRSPYIGKVSVLPVQ